MSNKSRTSSRKSDKKTPSPWFSTSELLEYLGIPESALVNELKLLKEGIHYKRENPDQPNSQILWRIDLIDELLCFPIPPLEKEAMLNAINNRITCQE